jgi:hypothetical protein
MARDITPYVENMKQFVDDINEDAVQKIVNHLGITLENNDAALVSGTDQTELDRVRESWLQRKLGRKESDDELNAAIDVVVEKMGRSNPKKCRVAFYYILAANYGVLGDL